MIQSSVMWFLQVCSYSKWVTKMSNINNWQKICILPSECVACRQTKICWPAKLSQGLCQSENMFIECSEMPKNQCHLMPVMFAQSWAAFYMCLKCIRSQVVSRWVSPDLGDVDRTLSCTLSLTLHLCEHFWALANSPVETTDGGECPIFLRLTFVYVTTTNQSWRDSE